MSQDETARGPASIAEAPPRRSHDDPGDFETGVDFGRPRE